MEVEDTVGCGDAFTAAVLVNLLESDHDVVDIPARDLDRALRFANAAAAMTATGPGVMGALPTRAEVEEFLGDASDRPVPGV